MIPINRDFDKTQKMFREIFYYPHNNDVVMRDFEICGKKAFIIYIDGMSGGDKISEFILKPLMQTGKISDDLSAIIQVSSMEESGDLELAADSIVRGDCGVFIEGKSIIYICETKEFEKRGIERPQVENSVIGTQEGFCENFRTNTGLLRRIIRTTSLTTETVNIGKIGNLSCGVCYLRDIANPKLVDEVKRRLHGIDTDFAQGGGMIAQFISDRTNSLFQTVTETERPDNTAAFLMQGRVAIIVEGSSRVIIAPISLSNMLKTSEENALHPPLASVVRAIRLLAVFAALLMPALYIAITTYHPAMIPGGLALSLATARTQIPYPAVLELLLMEVAFEMIREAGERVPGLLGSTIGIVGGLILGEAAVAAGLVSQACVVVIAFTALGTFAIPQYQLSFTARLLRIGFIIMGGMFGLPGVCGAFLLLCVYLNSLTSFGSDYVSPVFSSSAPLFPKQPIWKFEKRPYELNTKDDEYQPKISMTWKKGE